MDALLQDYLKIVTPHLSTELVTTQAKRQLQALAQRLPIPSAALLECRLSDSGSNVDFHASFTHFPPTLLNNFLLNPAKPSVMLGQLQLLSYTSRFATSF